MKISPSFASNSIGFTRDIFGLRLETHALAPADITVDQKAQIAWKTADDLFSHLERLRQSALP